MPVIDPLDPTASVDAFLKGNALATDFGTLLTAFMEERVLPIAQELVAIGQDPKVLLRQFARLVRVAADAIDAQAE